MFLPVITLCMAGIDPSYETCTPYLGNEVQPVIEMCDKRIMQFVNQPKIVEQIESGEVILYSLQCIDLFDKENSKKAFSL